MARNSEDDTPLEQQLAAKEKEDLETFKQDLCTWLSALLEEKITPSSFLDCLDNGVLLCKLARLIQEAAKKKEDAEVHIPLEVVHCNPKANSKDFHARDNASNFIDWCKKLGVKEIFESEGLVLHKDEKRVVLCLMDVARYAAKVDISPLPQLIEMEVEIEKQQNSKPPAEMQIKVNFAAKEALPQLVETEIEHQSFNPPTEMKMEVDKPLSSKPPMPSTESQVKTDVETEIEIDKQQSFNPPTEMKMEVDKPLSSKPTMLSTKSQVKTDTDKCSCTNNKLRFEYKGNGKYIFRGGNIRQEKLIVFTRLVNGKIMVRVGGGWVSWDYFLLKYDPCRSKKH